MKFNCTQVQAHTKPHRHLLMQTYAHTHTYMNKEGKEQGRKDRQVDEERKRDRLGYRDRCRETDLSE